MESVIQFSTSYSSNFNSIIVQNTAELINLKAKIEYFQKKTKSNLEKLPKIDSNLKKSNLNNNGRYDEKNKSFEDETVELLESSMSNFNTIKELDPV